MENAPMLEFAHPSYEGRIGIARRDITPPPGIYSRMWGCAEHDTAEGIHRPLLATAISFQSSAGGAPMVLVSLDSTWWRSEKDEWLLRESVLKSLSLDASRLMIHSAHTHSGPSISRADADKPGGNKIETYLDHLQNVTIEAAREAIASAEEAVLTWATGRCDLAANRDLPSPNGDGMLCGFNPLQGADDTLLAGRVTNRSGMLLATLVNYACHPTSLGGKNRLISPDYIGAMRELIEEATHQAPCLFLQGASGELGPRQGYEQAPDIADRNGRQLGHAVLSALTGMLPHRQMLRFSHAQDSGATLGIWNLADHHPSKVFHALSILFDIPLRKDLPTVSQLAEQLATCTDRAERERLERLEQRLQSLGRKSHFTMPLWGWRLGDLLLIGSPAEAYSLLQTELRKQFPRRAVAVLNLVNGYAGYLPPRETFEKNTYQANISLLTEGCLEQTLHESSRLLRQLEQYDES
jgi:hypothetical protein